jgi:hypothetical protein
MKDGKKTVAQKVFYDAFELLKKEKILWCFLKQQLIMSVQKQK